MDRLPVEANEEGSIDSLYAAIRKNPLVLADIDQIPYADTPLHAAASDGNISYAMEIMRLMPSFARKPNHDGFTPIHIALQKQHFQLVVLLLNMDSYLVRVEGREGITPLHYVVEKGNLDLLNRFLAICPRSIEDVTIRNETALHIALKYNMFEAFELLLYRLHCDFHEDASCLEKKILNYRNIEGDTVLHIATYRNQPQLVKMLTNWRVDVNVKNCSGQTALDIAEHGNMAEIRTLLCSVGAARPTSFPANETGASLRKDLRLQIAAEEGDIDVLYSIICEDPYLLDRFDRESFVDNPMHIAASKGHSQFVLEMMVLKPSLAKKLNQDGFSPMHLPLQNGHFQTARRLLDMDGDLVRVVGRAGKTPLHFVAENGNTDLLAEFLTACPKSVKDVTNRKETALHVAAKNEMWEAFKLLCGWLQLTGQNEVLNWTDDEGNSVLHIAASKSETEAVKLLTGRMNLSIKNMKDETAMDILNEHPPQTNRITKIKRILTLAGALKISKTSSISEILEKKMTWIEKWGLARYREKLSLSDENRNALLVVAVLIATATYQSVISPPGGLWQGDPKLQSQETHTDEDRRALSLVGTPVLVQQNGAVWYYFSCLNTATFITSMAVIYNLLPRIPLVILPLVIPLFLCYGISWVFTNAKTFGYFILVAIFLSIIALMWIISRLFARRWKELDHLIAKSTLETDQRRE